MGTVGGLAAALAMAAPAVVVLVVLVVMGVGALQVALQVVQVGGGREQTQQRRVVRSQQLGQIRPSLQQRSAARLQR